MKRDKVDWMKIEHQIREALQRAADRRLDPVQALIIIDDALDAGTLRGNVLPSDFYGQTHNP